MDVLVKDAPDRSRYEVFADGRLAGFTRYRLSHGHISFDHTEIDDEFEGQGLGSKLVSKALDDARDRGLAVLPFCPFVNSYIKRHREYADLVPESDRERFGL
jgi:uncharacterized protein